jgi:hypothetical protein
LLAAVVRPAETQQMHMPARKPGLAHTRTVKFGCPGGGDNLHSVLAVVLLAFTVVLGWLLIALGFSTCPLVLCTAFSNCGSAHFICCWCMYVLIW